MKKIVLLLAVILFLKNPLVICAEETMLTVDISAPYAVLMEASTGKIIYEKAADTICAPASITKIMTLLLIFDALEQGKISPKDSVMTSAHAQSMGGSQVFLEEGEMQTVDTLIKCIAFRFFVMTLNIYI